MKPSKNCYDLIKAEEGCVLHAYKDPGSGMLPITIGWGSTMRKNGDSIHLGETVTQQEADELLEWEVNNKAKVVNSLLLTTMINQNQFDALVSFAYNCGVGSFQHSTMRKKILLNPDDISIRNEFMRWNKAAGKELAGLTKRRKHEADLYFLHEPDKELIT